MPSFDVVNKLDYQEIDNAIGNTIREIENRYDFKGSKSSLQRKEKEFIIITEDELKLNQIHGLIISHLVKRKVDPLCISKKNIEKISGSKLRQIYTLIEGIDQSIAKDIVSKIKKLKIKVQVKINGNELRVEGKKKDDLQYVMQTINESNLKIPIQFTNFRD